MWFDPVTLVQLKPCPPATSATSATFDNRTLNGGLKVAKVARVATGRNLNIADPRKNVGAANTPEPFDAEAFEERAAICELDGGLNRADAEALAWQEDDRRRCTQCRNLRGEMCSIAKPEAGALVVASRGYRPVILPLRCAGYAPKLSDTDQRIGAERWPGLVQKGN